MPDPLSNGTRVCVLSLAKSTLTRLNTIRSFPLQVPTSAFFDSTCPRRQVETGCPLAASGPSYRQEPRTGFPNRKDHGESTPAFRYQLTPQCSFSQVLLVDAPGVPSRSRFEFAIGRARTTMRAAKGAGFAEPLPASACPILALKPLTPAPGEKVDALREVVRFRGRWP